MQFLQSSHEKDRSVRDDFAVWMGTLQNLRLDHRVGAERKITPGRNSMALDGLDPSSSQGDPNYFVTRPIPLRRCGGTSSI